MRFEFRDLPDPTGPATRARPIIDITVGELGLAPQACLLDSGATAVRMGMHVAELIGLDLHRAPATRTAVGGALVDARQASVVLKVTDGTDAHAWEARVWFCEPWAPAFGLVGLTGFFDQFTVIIDAYDEKIELRPRRY